MALIHGKKTVVIIDGNDLSQYCNESEFGKTTDTHETTHYGDDAKEHSPGLNDSTFTVGGHYDTTASTGPRAVFNDIYDGNAAVPIIRQPEGTGSGLAQDSFNAVLTNYVETSPVGDYVTWSAEFQTTGDVDDTPQP